MSDKVLTVRQAARIMDRSNSHICALARQGELDAKKWGKFWFIDPASVQRYMDEVAVKPMPEELDDPEALEKLYQEHGTFKAVADALGCNKATVGSALRRHGITIRNRREAATPEFIPEPVDLKRWMDVAIIYHKAGLHKAGIRPPRPEEMCPPNCPGRDWCLDGGECVMAEGSNGNGNRRKPCTETSDLY